MSSPVQREKENPGKGSNGYKDEAYGSTQVTLYTQTTLNGWYREMWGGGQEGIKLGK